MTRCEVAIGRDAEIAGTGAARIRTVRTAVDLAHRINHIGERIALARDYPPFKLAAALDHLPKHYFEMLVLQFAAPVRGGEHRGEPDAVKSLGDEGVERGGQRDVLRGDGDPGG